MQAPSIKNANEIKTMRRAGKVLAETLEELRVLVRPGTQTSSFDIEARRIMEQKGAMPSFLYYRSAGASTSFPSAICVSVNDEIVHGIPGSRILKQGDIVSLDLGAEVDGYHTDAAVTVGVGDIPYITANLLRATEAAMWSAIRRLMDGYRTGDIGADVESVLVKNKLGVVRELVGHGIGRSVHEDPPIPNYGKRGTGEVLREGMTICIEPMSTLGSPAVKLLPDGWTYATADGSLSAHFEHTILVTKSGYEVLTSI